LSGSGLKAEANISFFLVRFSNRPSRSSAFRLTVTAMSMFGAMANLRPRDQGQHGLDLPSLDAAERQREGPEAPVTPPAISKQVSNST
jgi:hypothetical protein